MPATPWSFRQMFTFPSLGWKWQKHITKIRWWTLSHRVMLFLILFCPDADEGILIPCHFSPWVRNMENRFQWGWGYAFLEALTSSCFQNDLVTVLQAPKLEKFVCYVLHVICFSSMLAKINQRNGTERNKNQTNNSPTPVLSSTQRLIIFSWLLLKTTIQKKKKNWRMNVLHQQCSTESGQRSIISTV